MKVTKGWTRLTPNGVYHALRNRPPRPPAEAWCGKKGSPQGLHAASPQKGWTLCRRCQQLLDENARNRENLLRFLTNISDPLS